MIITNTFLNVLMNVLKKIYYCSLSVLKLLTLFYFVKLRFYGICRLLFLFVPKVPIFLDTYSQVIYKENWNIFFILYLPCVCVLSFLFWELWEHYLYIYLFFVVLLLFCVWELLGNIWELWKLFYFFLGTFGLRSNFLASKKGWGVDFLR